MKPLLLSLRRYYSGLSPADRRALTLLSCFISIVGLWLLVWQPVEHMRVRSEEAFIEARSDLAWMQAHAAEARISGASGSSRALVQHNINLFSATGETASAAGISMARVEPSGDAALRVNIDSASFSRLLGWLEQMEKQDGIRVSQLSIEKLADPGTVSATLLLVRQ
jgi:general secretion pathway protein M